MKKGLNFRMKGKREGEKKERKKKNLVVIRQKD